MEPRALEEPKFSDDLELSPVGNASGGSILLPALWSIKRRSELLPFGSDSASVIRLDDSPETNTDPASL